MRGDDVDLKDLGACGDFKTNDDLGVTESISGNALVGSDAANPCGGMAAWLFSDSFSISSPNN